MFPGFLQNICFIITVFMSRFLLKQASLTRRPATLEYKEDFKIS